MACKFGLGPEATDWLAAQGGAALGGFRKRTESLAASFPWGAPSGGKGQRGHAAATAFGEHEKKAAAEPAADKAGKADKDDAEDPEKKSAALGCFPGCSSVYVKGRGPVHMADIQVGDHLLCGDAAGSLSFSLFLGYLHREAERCAEYLELRLAPAGTALRVSAEHLVFVARAAAGADAPATAMPARDVCEGDWICRVSCDGDLYRVKVAAVSKARQVGVFAPLTQCGTVVVDSTLCSCYADAFPETMPLWLHRLAASHQTSHGVMLPLRLACRMGWGTVPGEDAKASPQGIHPYCRALMAVPLVAQAMA